MALVASFGVPLPAQARLRPDTASRIMMVGVTHDASVMGGGISGRDLLPPQIVNLEPIAWLTPSGEWSRLPCALTETAGYSAACLLFERQYLDRPHRYTVVSADGMGARVQTQGMALDQECFGVGGRGEYSGGPIRIAAVAADQPAFFVAGSAARRVTGPAASALRRSLARAVGHKLDSVDDLRVYAFNLEGENLVVLQRSFQDYTAGLSPAEQIPKEDLIFAIGTVDHSRFRVLYWKEDTADYNEQILGLVRLRAGRDFLVTTTSHPEGDFFRVYGVRNGRLYVAFTGGGGGC